MSPYPTRMTYRHLPNPVTSTLRITHGLCSPWHCCFSGAHPQHLWTIPPLSCQLCKKAAFPSSPFQTTNWAFYKQIWFFILGAPAWHLDEALTIQHESSSIVSNTRKEVGESSGTEAKSKTQVSSQGDCDVSIQQRACVRSGGDEGILKFSLVVIHFFSLQPYMLFPLTNFSNIYFDPWHSEVFVELIFSAPTSITKTRTLRGQKPFVWVFVLAVRTATSTHHVFSKWWQNK